MWNYSYRIFKNQTIIKSFRSLAVLVRRPPHPSPAKNVLFPSNVHQRRQFSLNRICLSKYHEMEKNLQYRRDPVIATLNSAEFKSTLTPNVLLLHQMFTKYGYELRIAGGAVRLVDMPFRQFCKVMIFMTGK